MSNFLAKEGGGGDGEGVWRSAHSYIYNPRFPNALLFPSLLEMRMDNDGTGIVKKHCHAGQNDETTRWYRDSLMLDSDNNYLREQRGSLHTFIVRCLRYIVSSITIIYIFRKVKRENFGQYTCRYFQFYLP